MHLYWDKHNPWRDRLIYLPDLKELSACIRPSDPDKQYRHWLDYHQLMVDAYIIPAQEGAYCHSIGIRYGAEGPEYYSPHVNMYISSLLLLKYGPMEYLKQ